MHFENFDFSNSYSWGEENIYPERVFNPRHFQPPPMPPHPCFDSIPGAWQSFLGVFFWKHLELNGPGDQLLGESLDGRSNMISPAQDPGCQPHVADNRGGGGRNSSFFPPVCPLSFFCMQGTAGSCQTPTPDYPWLKWLRQVLTDLPDR